MDYSSAIKNLLSEISCQRSYSRLHPLLKVIMIILMAPFFVLGATTVAFYYVLLFLRNCCCIFADEVEGWLDKKKEGEHFLPVAVLYAVTVPFIFFCRVLIALFSKALYFTWLEMMIWFYVATLGGIRWQPSLNLACFDQESYVWDFKHSAGVHNLMAIVNICLIVLCVLNLLLNDGVPYVWLLILTAVMIYVVYPQVFCKKNIHALESEEEIYAVAAAYAEKPSLANYTRAVALLKKIPNYRDAETLIGGYTAYIEGKKSLNAKIGQVVMLILATVVVAVAIGGPIVEKLDNSGRDNKYLSYVENTDGTYRVWCSSYDVKNLEIEERYKGEDVTKISNSAFEKCEDLRTVFVPQTVTSIGDNAFRDCESLREIVFDGTRDEWYAIEKGASWDKNAGDYIVTCTDGTIR